MSEVISNTSPLLYLHHIGALVWLPKLFSEIWIPMNVVLELQEGIRRGYNTPDPLELNWLTVVEPQAVPVEWLALDLGPGELSVLALGLENPNRTVLLDDRLARWVAQAAGLTAWGTLRVLLEAKSQGLTTTIKPLVSSLEESGMWISSSIRQRILRLAGEE